MRGVRVIRAVGTLIVRLFEFAERLAGGETMAADAMREFVRATVAGDLEG